MWSSVCHGDVWQSPKALELRRVAREQFRANLLESDPQKIHQLKARAESMLSSYVLYERATADPRFARAREEAKRAAGGDEPVEYEMDDEGNMYEVRYTNVLETEDGEEVEVDGDEEDDEAGQEDKGRRS